MALHIFGGILLFLCAGCIHQPKQSSPASEPFVKVELSSGYQCLQLLRLLKSDAGTAQVEEAIDSLLDSKTYQFMLSHFNRPWRPNTLPRDDLKRMILSLKSPELFRLNESETLKEMRSRWLVYYQRPERLESILEQLKKADLQPRLNEAVLKAQAWLPLDMPVPPHKVFIDLSFQKRTRGYANSID